jgi:hypothetical protein
MGRVSVLYYYWSLPSIHRFNSVKDSFTPTINAEHTGEYRVLCACNSTIHLPASLLLHLRIGKIFKTWTIIHFLLPGLCCY